MRGGQQPSVQKPLAPAQAVLAVGFPGALVLVSARCCSAGTLRVRLSLRGLGELGAGQGLGEAPGEIERTTRGEAVGNAPRLCFVVHWQVLLLVCTLVFIATYLSHEKTARLCCSANIAGLCKASLGVLQL